MVADSRKNTPARSDAPARDETNVHMPEGHEHAARTGGHANLQAKVDTLESRLREKEQLVAALTERLEQAAEQLDRVHRSGADRGARGGGFPPELVEEQKSLVEDLQRAVAQWENLQAAASLGRIEVQISEVRDLIAGQVLERLSAPPPPPEAPSPPPSAAVPAENPTRGKTSGGGSRPGQSQVSGYEALKASLLADAAQPEQESTGGPGAAHAGSGRHQPAETLDEPPPVDVPEPLDVATAGIDELRAAVEVRDSYIGWLNRKLRAAELRRKIPGDWSELENVPDELRAHLEELEGRLEEMLRLGEVELSLERARLGREAARLEQLDQQVQKKMRRLGISSDGDKVPEEQAVASAGDRKDRRWLRMLGMSKGESGENGS